MTFEQAERWYGQGFITVEEWTTAFLAQGLRDSIDHPLSYNSEWPSTILDDVLDAEYIRD